jgi:hypothetical protein
MVNNPLKTKKIRGSFLFDLATYIQLVLLYARYHNMKRHTKLLTHIPNKKELHLTAHAATTVVANELPVYLSKRSICPMTLQYSDDKKQKRLCIFKGTVSISKKRDIYKFNIVFLSAY